MIKIRTNIDVNFKLSQIDDVAATSAGTEGQRFRRVGEGLGQRHAVIRC